MAKRSCELHSRPRSAPPAELLRALRLAAPYRFAGYGVLMVELAQRPVFAPLLLCGWAALLFGMQARLQRERWVLRRADALVFIQGAEAALLAALIWLPPSSLASALLLSASLLLANGALGGLRCVVLAACCLVAAAGLLRALALGPEGELPALPAGVGGLPARLVSLLPELILLIVYGLCFSVLGYGRVRRLQRRQRQQQAHLIEHRARAERLQRYLPHSLAEHLASPSQGVRQRCWLLIAYADLCDFTPLTVRLEADALAEVLDDYLARINRLAVATDAVVAKVLGDGVLLFWRPRNSQEHGRQRAAQRALRFVDDLPQELGELSRFWQARGEPLRLRARTALTSGYCTLGDWGATGEPDPRRLEYTVIGTPVNLAARLQTLGEPGGVVIDERTRLLLQDQARFDAGRVVTVRGLGEQRIFELGSERQRHLTLVR